MHLVARECFGAWEREDDTNGLWNKIAALYPPNDKGVSLVPDVVEFDNVKIDCVTGTIMCLKPGGKELINVILHVRDSKV